MRAFVIVISGSTAHTNKIPSTVPTFSTLSDRMSREATHSNMDRLQKTKMAADKPELLKTSVWKKVSTRFQIFDVAWSNGAYNDNVRRLVHFQFARSSGFAATSLVLGLHSASQFTALCGIRLGDIKNMGTTVEFATMSCSKPKL